MIVAGEVALLLHELSHAFVARRSGQAVERIVFHGFVAETIVGSGSLGPGQEALVALAGPAMNVDAGRPRGRLPVWGWPARAPWTCSCLP